MMVDVHKGTVSLTFVGMPAELVAHFDPRTPLLAGAVAPAEAGTGFLRLRLKRHRWFPKTLKTRDPLIFSIGARLLGCPAPCFLHFKLHLSATMLAALDSMVKCQPWCAKAVAPPTELLPGWWSDHKHNPFH
jgi:40S ribosome biogenesis protein Tsr1 and BMS1 C-terminal